MSLINQMLQDLEKRRAAEQTADHPLPPPVGSSRRRPGLAAICALVAVLFGLGSFGYVLIQHHSRQGVKQSVAAVPRPPAPATKTTAARAPAAVASHRAALQLLSLGYTGDTETPRLVAEFNGAPDFHLAAESSKGWTVTLRDVRNTAKVASPQPSESWLPTVSLSQDGQSLVVHLSSRTPCRVNAFLLPAGEGYGNRLVIAFTRVKSRVAAVRRAPSPPAPVAPTAPAAAVATQKPVAVAAKNSAGLAATRTVASKTAPLAKTPHALTMKERAGIALDQGRKALSAGNDQEAESQLRQALDLDPRSRSARETLVALLLRESRVAEAEQVLTSGIKLIPGDASFKKVCARLLVDQGEWTKALNVLQQKPLPQMTGDPDYNALLAAIDRHLGDNEAAAAIYENLVTIRPQAGLWWLGLGLSEEGRGDRAAAATSYRRALACGDLKPALASYAKGRLVVLKR